MYDNVPGPEEIRVFLGQLLVDSGITPVAELQESMIDDLEDRLSTHLMQAITSLLQPTDFEEFIKISETDPTEGQKFLATKINNLPEVYQNALIEFRQMFLKS